MQKLQRVPTYFICFNHFNGTEPTVIYFVNIHFQCKKVDSYHLIHYWMRVVLFLFKTNLFQPVLFPITLYFYFADSQQLMH